MLVIKKFTKHNKGSFTVSYCWSSVFVMNLAKNIDLEGCCLKLTLLTSLY